ncbi:MAG: hypothetical protein WB785_00155 [Mycobacterium sp.]|uniref:DUF7373 family lipoprotein n=1 Tax=Mycobacterium sp. TaxID=1785 RepID=UPI003C5BD35D
MSKRNTRVVSAALAGAVAMTLVSCTSTVSGVAVIGSQSTDADGAVVALLDTGKYPTTAGHPVGTAGSQATGAVLEAQRMAEYVVGPWQVNAHPTQLRQTNFLATQAAPDIHLLKDALPQPVPDIASAHGVITAFITSRTSSNPQVPLMLTNLVMRFPDPAAASAAATEMAAATSRLPDPPRSPIAIHNQPEALASAHDELGDQTAINSFAAHGAYVLYQSAKSKKEEFADLASQAEELVEGALRIQENLIDQFAATDPAKLADLPLDPTGKLLARTLPTSDSTAALVVGVWQPRAWLHFEEDPIAAAASYAADGVEVIAEGLTTVYQTSNAGGAARMVQRFTTRLGPSVKAISGVPGLPAAKCLARQGMAPAPTLHEMTARYSCIASADQYAFIAYSDTEKDVKQQISAQYRILAGK